MNGMDAANYMGKIRVDAAPTAVFLSGPVAKVIPATRQRTGITAAMNRNVLDRTTTSPGGVTQKSRAGMEITKHVWIKSYLHAKDAANYMGQIWIHAAQTAVSKSGPLTEVMPVIVQRTGITAATENNVGDQTPTRRG